VRNTEALVNQIAQNDKLASLRTKLDNELVFRSGAGGGAQFSPMLILMAISIVVQVILACRNKNSEAQLIDDLRNARTLPRWRVLQMRRKINALWSDYCEGDDCDKNILYDALLDIAENAADEEIEEILKLANSETK
jgi:hypothetical protein